MKQHQWMAWVRVAAVLGCLWCQGVWADAYTRAGGDMPILVAREELQQLPLTPYLAELGDPEGHWQIQDILQRDAQFQPVASYISHGFGDSVWWFRFTATNPSPHEVHDVFESNLGYLFDLQLYETDEGRVLGQWASGLHYPYEDRLIQSAQVSLPMIIPAGATRVFYVRVHMKGQAIFPATISGIQAHANRALRNRSYDNLFYGLGLGIALYNLLLFLSIRQKYFAYYAAYVGFIIMTVAASDDGSLYQFWPPGLSGYAFLCIFVWADMAMLCLLLFSEAFLEVPDNTPNPSRVPRALMVGCVTHIALLPLLPMEWVIMGTMLLSGLVLVSTLAKAVWLWRRAPNASLYVLSSLAMILAVFMSLLYSPAVNLVNDPVIAHYWLELGFSLQMLLLSLGLGRQINDLKQRDIDVSTQLLKARLKEVTANMQVVKARSEAESKGRFLAAMSHEIRTPMNGVLGMAELLAGTRLDREQHRYLDAILNSGRALLNILNDILDYSKIEAGRLELEDIPFDLHRLSRDCLEIFSVQKRQQVSASLEIDPAVPVIVSGDPTRLRQVLMNLLSNAFKFTEHGTVVLALTLASEEESQVRVRMDVKDTGVGIPEAQQSRLFESFTQADSSTTRRFGGTGLGLAISRELVHLMGGAIALQSTPGEGTCVHVEVPLRRVDPDALAVALSGGAQSSADEDQPLKGMCLLVAEDNPVNCMVIEGLLRRMGVHCHMAVNGHEALEAYRGNPQGFDAVLMDCEMPVMDGYAAVEAMRVLEEENGWPRIPVLALTAHAGLDSPSHSAFDAILHKPVGRAGLQAALQAISPPQG